MEKYLGNASGTRLAGIVTICDSLVKHILGNRDII